MSKEVLFEDFETWSAWVAQNPGKPIYTPVLEFEKRQRGKTDQEIWDGLHQAWQVMKEAVATGLSEDLLSRSGMVTGSGKKVHNSNIVVLSAEFKRLVSRALAAKEVNSCMGRIVAAPTAGASGIMPGVLYTLQEIHELEDQKILECLLMAAGVALIIEYKASIAGAVGGCQAETGSAAAMGAASIVYALGGNFQQVTNAVAITIQCMLGLICDPVAGLVEVPCIVRNASAAAIANSSAQMALSFVDAVIPVDECIDAMGEVGQAMETRYKETALGGLAATPTGKAIAKKVLISDIHLLEEENQ